MSNQLRRSSGLFILLALASPIVAQPPRSDDGEPRAHGLFVSPMGEPFRGPDGLKRWLAGADGNSDGRLTAAECVSDAARFFAALDANKDGEIDPAELDTYENTILPEVQSDGGFGGGRERTPGGHRRGGGRGGRHGMGGGGGDRPTDGNSAALERQGAARYGLLDLPEPVIAADTNFDRGISPAEFRAAATTRCHALDRDGDGYVTEPELPLRHDDRRRDAR